MAFTIRDVRRWSTKPRTTHQRRRWVRAANTNLQQRLARGEARDAAHTAAAAYADTVYTKTPLASNHAGDTPLTERIAMALSGNERKAAAHMHRITGIMQHPRNAFTLEHLMGMNERQLGATERMLGMAGAPGSTPDFSYLVPAQPGEPLLATQQRAACQCSQYRPCTCQQTAPHGGQRAQAANEGEPDFSYLVPAQPK